MGVSGHDGPLLLVFRTDRWQALPLRRKPGSRELETPCGRKDGLQSPQAGLGPPSTSLRCWERGDINWNTIIMSI